MDKSTTKKLEEVLLNLDHQKELDNYINDENNMIAYNLIKILALCLRKVKLIEPTLIKY